MNKRNGMTANVMMGQEKCPVCTKDHETDEILIRKHLLEPKNESNDRFVVTGWGICPDCKQKIKDGFFPMIVIDIHRSEVLPNGNLSLEGAWRTGEVLYLKKAVAQQILNTELVTSFSFLDEEGAARIKSMIR